MLGCQNHRVRKSDKKKEGLRLQVQQLKREHGTIDLPDYAPDVLKSGAVRFRLHSRRFLQPCFAPYHVIASQQHHLCQVVRGWHFQVDRRRVDPSDSWRAIKALCCSQWPLRFSD